MRRVRNKIGGPVVMSHLDPINRKSSFLEAKLFQADVGNGEIHDFSVSKHKSGNLEWFFVVNHTKGWTGAIASLGEDSGYCVMSDMFRYKGFGFEKRFVPRKGAETAQEAFEYFVKRTGEIDARDLG